MMIDIGGLFDSSYIKPISNEDVTGRDGKTRLVVCRYVPEMATDDLTPL